MNATHNCLCVSLFSLLGLSRYRSLICYSPCRKSVFVCCNMRDLIVRIQNLGHFALHDDRRYVFHSVRPADNQLTERQDLTLHYSHAEEAALGLAIRANRALTGSGLSPSLCTHTQAGLRGTIRQLTCQPGWVRALAAN